MMRSLNILILGSAMMMMMMMMMMMEVGAKPATYLVETVDTNANGEGFQDMPPMSIGVNQMHYLKSDNQII